jgi:hypothetical protein
VQAGAARQRYREMAPVLDEQSRRRFVALEAQRLGRGGVSLMARISGLARSTIYHGLSDIRHHILAPVGRTRFLRWLNGRTAPRFSSRNFAVAERPFKLPYVHVGVGTRMTIIRVAQGGLLVHSPVKMETARKIASVQSTMGHVSPSLGAHRSAMPRANSASDRTVRPSGGTVNTIGDCRSKYDLGRHG